MSTKGRESTFSLVWKDSGPGRFLSVLALAWEYSLVSAIFRLIQLQIKDSLLLPMIGRGLAIKQWEHSWLAAALEAAGEQLARALSRLSQCLQECARHALSWRAGRYLVQAGQHAASVRLAGFVFPFMRDVSWTGWLLAGFAFVFPFLPTSLNLVAAWGVLAMVLLLHVGPARGRPAPSTIALAVFAVALLVATAGSANLPASMTSLLLWATYLGLYLAASHVARTWANAQAMVMALLGGGAIVASLALAQWLLGVETSAAWVDARLHQDITTRAFSVFGNPNILAGHLALLIPVSLLAAMAYRRLPTRLFTLACLGVMGMGLLVTLSRGALLAVFLSIGLLAVLRDRRYVVVLLALAILFVALAPPVIMDRLISALTFEDTSARYRTTIWLASWRLLQDYWFTGTGLGPASFGEVYPMYRIAGTPAAHTHNLYLQLVVELGLAGAFAFLLFMASWTRRLLARMQGQAGWLAAAIVAAIGGAALHGLVENIWYSPKSLMLFWLLLGLGSALCSKTEPAGETP